MDKHPAYGALALAGLLVEVVVGCANCTGAIRAKSLVDEPIRNGSNDLDRRIADAQAKQRRGVTNAAGQAESRGWAVGIEFVGVVLVSGFIGWAIDNMAGLGTKPWAMIVMLVLGFAAGTRRAMKTSAQFDASPDNDKE